MAVRAREDEVGIGATLYVGAEQCLYAIVGLVEISEYLIKCNFRIHHVADAYSPNWSLVDIERDF